MPKENRGLGSSMEDTSRAFAVLAAVVLVLAPVTNGVLEEAAKTAERVFLDPADWNQDPPEDPPNATPPEDLPENNQTFNGSAGASPSCEVQTEPVAGWRHEPVDEQPSSGTSNRSTDPQSQVFAINESHIGLGVALQIENLRGDLSASIYPQGDDSSQRFSYESDAFTSQNAEDVNRTSTIPREDLENGEWVAELNYRSAHYDELTFAVVRASCAGVSS